MGLGADNQVIVATGSEPIVREATTWQLVDLSAVPAPESGSEGCGWSP
ncbi:MAG: hypothetical protein HY744_28700 [Deltaproteobacteria bacterium]|nr:hypothetical protein [Deltaproteobacteria bacterium]